MRAKFRVIPSAIAMVLVSACAAAPKPVSDVARDIPSQFVGSNQSGAIDTRWWKSFGDLRLTTLVEEGVLQNPSIGQSMARLEQARAQARISRADLLPQVSAGLGAVGRGGAGNTGILHTLDLSVNVGWETDLWERLSSLNAADRADFLATAANLRAVQQAVAAQTVRTYFAVIEAEQQIALSSRVLETYGELTRQLNLRVEAGISPLSSKTLVITDQQTARGGLEARQEDYKRLVRQLEIILRDYPDGQIELADALPALPPVPVTGLPSELLSRRPDVVAADLQLAAAGYRLDAAKRSFLPSLSLSGSAGTSAGSFANLFDGGFFIWSIAGQLLQPIFQGGRLRAQVDQREGEQDEALERYAEVALQALFEVETALAIDSNLAAREAAFLVAADAAEQSLDISTKRYRAGIEPFFNVLETQQRALNARSAYLSTRRDRLFNRVDLHLALGGGFE
ncbi:efflux transporter outer membrane subunit [Sphingorhabdus sp. Alg231-15]|uniref:efflux transporter outer membrane subunit n=1 Tax=Sphingorhabdus sp. Alg231-15 TaxID=1922222 RepID=UPI000D54EE1C